MYLLMLHVMVALKSDTYVYVRLTKKLLPNHVIL